MSFLRWCAGSIVLLFLMSSMGGAGVLSLGSLDSLPKLKPGRTMRASSSDPDWQNGNGDCRPIPPGDTLVIAELEGPGVIRHIWNTIAAEERGYSRLVVIRMYWDGEDAPSVACPLGDFFGMGHGHDKPVHSLPIRVTSEGRARNCYWPMPFRKSAKIAIANEGNQPVRGLFWYVDWQKLPELDADVAYFHAMYRQEHPARMGRNYLIADIEGAGHYVGTVLNVRQHTPHWWGEGDDLFFIDGETEPSVRGTGTEDYFCDAWGFRPMEGPFYGAPLFEGLRAYDRATVYRWHIPDPVTFTKSLCVEIEHKGVTFDDGGNIQSHFGERADDFSSVAFWYQREPHKPFGPLPPPYNRLYFDYSKMTEAETLVPQTQATAGEATVQRGPWSGGKQLFWTPPAEGATLSLPFDVAESGDYVFLVVLTHSHDYGRYRFEVDGKRLGNPLDLYNPATINREHVLDLGVLEAGTHTFTVHNAGKNDASERYFFGLDAFMPQKR